MFYIYDGTSWIPLILGEIIPPSGGVISNLAAAAGVGTITLTWDESGEIDSINIYQDEVLVDTIEPGVETWTSAPTDDGFYVWSVVPITDEAPGTGDDVAYGVMTADIYVDTENGSDSNNGSTPSLAVKTLNKAGTLISAPGDIVAIRGGTYSEYNVRATSGTYGGTLTTFDYSGTPENPIKILSFPGEDVVIDGSSITRPITGGTDAQRPELFSINADYYIFSGTEDHPIVLQNSAGCGFRTWFTNGVKVYHVHSHHHEGSGFNMQQANNWEVAYCAAWECYSTVNDGETADGVSGAGSSHAVVHDSFFGWNGDDGVDFILGTDNTVYNCVAYKNGYFMNGMAGQGNGNGFKMSGITNDNPSRNVFYNNIAALNRYIGFTFNGGVAWAESNTAIGNSDFGFAIGNGTPGENIVLRHNVAYNNGEDNSDDMLYNGVTPGVDEYNSWNIDDTPQPSDFVNVTFDEDWRSWDEVVSAQYGALDDGGSYKGKGEGGADIGYEGPEPTGFPIPDSGSAVIFGYGTRDDGYITTGNSFNYTASNFQGATYRAFWRFKLPDTLLPGATIDSATLELYNRDSSDAAQVKLYAHAVDNSTVPYNATTANNQISNLTTANVTWNLASSSDQTKAESPDISEIIQEIVDRPGFQAGNYVMLWSIPQSGAQKRFYTQEWHTYAQMPRLNISWTNPGAIEIPEIGENVYGGYYAGIIDTTKGNIISADDYQVGRRYLLILAPKSMEATISSSLQWRSSNADVPGAKTRWDGLSATKQMVNLGGAFEMANYVNGLSYPEDIGSQWYLPALDELELAYRSFKPTTGNNAVNSDTATFPDTTQNFGVNPSSDPTGSAYTTTVPARTSVSAFQGGNSEAFVLTPTQTYATSTWASSTSYWVQDMVDGWQFDHTQTTSSGLTIRPVRRVYIDGYKEKTFELQSAAHDGWNYNPFNGTDWSNSDDESWPGKDADVWYWFDLSEIPQGATIHEAKLSLVASTNKGGGGVVTLKAVDEDSAAVPESGADSVADISNLTTASATWTWGAQVNGVRYYSPNMAEVLQEIVDRAGWTGPVLIYGLHGGTEEQRVYAYENEHGNPNYRPKLTVVWEED